MYDVNTPQTGAQSDRDPSIEVLMNYRLEEARSSRTYAIVHACGQLLCVSNALKQL